ncbi:MAG: hypothetical protein K2P22_10695, partial [Lachnospiraceae bacterium]|nr:hypothetical protein [Lachnospiraceae bacterium]
MKRKPDPAHRRTDQELAGLEERIAAEYKKAAEELQAKIDAYFAQFQERDKAQKALIGTVVNGRVYTEQDYKQWRLAQIGRGRRFEALRDRAAERYTQANAVAAAYINDRTPGIYALNRNYAAYTIEQQVGRDVGFDLWDEQTVRRLIVEQPDLMPYYPPARAVNRGIDLAYGKRQITAQVTAGILQGESIKHLADRLQTNIPGMNRASAIRAARTAVTGAQNAGRLDSYFRAEEIGIRLKKRWLATLDGRTRHAHQLLDGQVQRNEEPFHSILGDIMFPGDPSAVPANVYNCFVGNVKVASDSEIIRSYKHKYTGELVVIKTSRGVEFACTPNHPILTPGGWVSAKSFNDGDNLLATIIGGDDFLRVNPDINHAFPSFDALHKTLYKTGGKRARSLRVNFHGDIPTSDVEIVTKKRFLRNNRNASGVKCVNKFLLEHSDKPLMSQCPFMEHFWRICKTAFRFISSKRETLTFFRRGLLHPSIHGFGTVSGRDVGVTQDTINNLTTKPEALRKVLDGFSGEIAVDKVVSVKIIPSGQTATHVYNLQTQSGYYFVNSSIPQKETKCNGIFAIAKNCRCTMIAEVDGVD